MDFAIPPHRRGKYFVSDRAVCRPNLGITALQQPESYRLFKHRRNKRLRFKIVPRNRLGRIKLF